MTRSKPPAGALALSRRQWLGSAAAGASLMLSPFVVTARAATTSVKLGVLTDLSGPYADLSGQGCIIGARLAAEEFNRTRPDLKVEILSADHQNKADVGATLARRWYDEAGVDAIVDVANSAVGLAVNSLTKERNKVFLASGPASSDFTGRACTPNTIQWTYDTYALSRGTGGALTRAGRDKWFFITADYAFGHALERDTTSFVEAAGGKVLGRVRAPINCPRTTWRSARARCGAMGASCTTCTFLR